MSDDLETTIKKLKEEFRPMTLRDEFNAAREQGRADTRAVLEHGEMPLSYGRRLTKDILFLAFLIGIAAFVAFRRELGWGLLASIPAAFVAAWSAMVVLTMLAGLLFGVAGWGYRKKHGIELKK